MHPTQGVTRLHPSAGEGHPPGRLIVVCGIPGAGKTTMARRLEADRGGLRLAPDEWMSALRIDLHDAGLRAAIEAAQWELARAALGEGRTVIIEWGTWTRTERDGLAATARRLGAMVELHVGETDPEVCWTRVERRQQEAGPGSRPLTRDEVYAAAACFEIPDAAELARYDPPRD